MKFSERFIKASQDMCGFDRHVPAPYLRKTFVLDMEPKQAEISICGLGFYELYINGQNTVTYFGAVFYVLPPETEA